MSFTAEQKASLEAPLSSTRVKARQQAGRSLSYIEGWWAISEANRIFGFDGWDRQTFRLKQLGDHREVDGKFRVAYMAMVRIIVKTKDGENVDGVLREGTGYGSGIDRDLGQAHESAIKEAETDAMKRALMTFGNPFGLALYDKDQAGVENDTPQRPSTGPLPQKPQPTQQPKQDEDIEQGVRNWTAQRRTELAECSRIPDLYQWKDQHDSALARLKSKHGAAYASLMLVYQDKFDQLSKKEVETV